MQIENESDEIQDSVLIRIVGCADGGYVNDYYTAFLTCAMTRKIDSMYERRD
jgi:hypothetical protein